jgi:hypothetical protein
MGITLICTVLTEILQLISISFNKQNVLSGQADLHNSRVKQEQSRVSQYCSSQCSRTLCDQTLTNTFIQHTSGTLSEYQWTLIGGRAAGECS